MRIELEAAYELISEYKRGAIEYGTEITTKQQQMLLMLAADLQVESTDVQVERVVQMVAREDSKWNRRTMEAVCRFYDLRGAGQLVEAEQSREAFMSECPSVWYCGIISSL